MALRAVARASAAAKTTGPNVVPQLFRNCLRNLPRALLVYNLDIPLSDARAAVAHEFRRHSGVRNPSVISMLVTQGYMDLEETLMQWRGRHHFQEMVDRYLTHKHRDTQRKDHIAETLRV